MLNAEIDPMPSWNERDRLAALASYDILDTPSEEAFDNIVRMAAHVCEAPIALVTFVAQDRQWFKANVGMLERETPLEMSICAHAILQREVFIVPDAAADVRFQNNPIVTGSMHVRFYAAALLKTPEGLPLGTVAVLDRKPRILSDEQALMLKALASQVMTQLDLRRTLKEKTLAGQRYRFLADTMPQIVWTAQPDGNLDYYNQRWFTYAKTDFEKMQTLGWTSFVHPEDLPEAATVWQKSLDTGCDYEVEFRVRRASDGSYRWHLVRAFPMKSEDGRVIQWVGTCTDIDDQRQLIQQNANAAAKFRSLFDQSSAFASIITLDGIILEANKLCLTSCGYEEKELVGKPFWSCGWWSGSKEFQEQIRAATKLAAEGTPFVKTMPYWFADGTERVADFALHPIRDASKQIVYLYCTGIDATERYQMYERREFLAQLTHTLALVSDPMEINRVATKEIGQFLGANRCFFLEVSSKIGQVQVMPDWHVEEIVSLEGTYQLADYSFPERWQALKSGPVSIEDVRTHAWTKDCPSIYQGREIAGCIIAPFVLEGKIVACLGVCSNRPRIWTADDIASLENAMARVWPLLERARVEEALRDSEERFRAMGDNIAPLAWMAHPDGSLFWYNKRWYDYSGETLDTMRGDGWTKLHDPEHLPHVFESWKKALSEGTPWEDTFPLRSVNGTYRWFLSRAYPIRDSEGKIKLWFGTNSDVTDMRAATAQLSDKATHLEALVQQRTAKLSETISELEAFSYSISHDMRSPLRSMVGYTEILKEEFATKLTPQAFDYLNRISTASRRMDQLIEDVLVFSRLSEADVVMRPVNVDALVRDIIQTYPNLRPELVEITICKPLPTVNGNEALLTQCISNLLDNGAKFVSPGKKAKIDIWAETAPSKVKLFFKDNGIGMSKHNLHRIFEIFHRVGRGNDGTGIGLAIVRKAAQKMGGSAGVESELGKGSLFWLDLPAS